MTWIRLDDNFPDHPKVIMLSDKAFRDYVTGLCYASRYLTDGFLADGVVKRLDAVLSAEELERVGLWGKTQNGWQIASYSEYQSSKKQVEAAKARNRERVAKWREKQNGNEETDFDRKVYDELDSDEPANDITNALVMTPHTPIHTHTHTDIEIKDYSSSLPRIHSARNAVERISNKLGEARRNGVNAWNLSLLIQEEWDVLHDANDIGGCIALTAWYISELLSRPLTSAEISRTGQMIKRFGRIALLAVDFAASKDIEDFVSYAYRVAENMYKERKA